MSGQNVGATPLINDSVFDQFQNGGRKHAQGKLRLSLVPTDGIRAVAQVMEKALEKYEEGNWQLVPVHYYRDACYRHLLSYIDNPTGLDAESGLPHYAHLAASALIATALEEKLKREVPE